MYAIVKTGGKQYKVAVDDVVTVEKIDGAPGDEISLVPVLLVDGDDGRRACRHRGDGAHGASRGRGPRAVEPRAGRCREREPRATARHARTPGPPGPPGGIAPGRPACTGGARRGRRGRAAVTGSGGDPV